MVKASSKKSGKKRTEEKIVNNRYKLCLFQDVYSALKNDQELDSEIAPEVYQFYIQIKDSSLLTALFLKIIENYLMLNSKNALFLADKLFTMSKDNEIAIYLLGECYSLDDDQVKVNFLFKKFNLLNRNINYLLLAAKGLIKNGSYEKALKILQTPLEKKIEDKEMTAELFYLIGQCQKNIENRVEAEKSFLTSLENDPSYYSSFEGYLDSQSSGEAKVQESLKELNFNPDMVWLRHLYSQHLQFKINQNEDNEQMIEETNNTDVMQILIQNDNIHLLFLKAKNLFEKYLINKSYEVCCKILERNFFHFDTLILYTEILVEKNLLSELFGCCSALSDNYPESFITYHIFGMYYFMLKKCDIARKYFNKAIQLNKNSLKSWIMLSHSFAIQEETEQAMNVYRSCIRLFPNSHLPHVYLGMEYLRINNLKTALISFNQAKELAPNDPFVYNEIGCIYLSEKKIIEAKKSFGKALKFCQTEGVKWLRATILNNLGHGFRKSKEYQSAIESYEESLSLVPNDASVLFSLGFSYHLIGCLSKAIEIYHKVLSMKYDTHFVNHMLMQALQDMTSKCFEQPNQIKQF